MARINTTRAAAAQYNGMAATNVRPVTLLDGSKFNKVEDQVICTVEGQDLQFLAGEVIMEDADREAFEECAEDAQAAIEKGKRLAQRNADGKRKMFADQKAAADKAAAGDEPPDHPYPEPDPTQGGEPEQKAS